MADYISNSSAKTAKKVLKSNTFIEHSICVTGLKLQMSISVFSLWWTENEKTPPIYNAGLRNRKGLWSCEGEISQKNQISALFSEQGCHPRLVSK